MSYHDKSTTLLANCRQLCKDVKTFKESKFERNLYNKINEDINHLNTLLDNLLSNLGNNENESDENKLFISNLGGIKLSLDQIKKTINPNFRINDGNKWLITSNFFKGASNISAQHQQLIDNYLVILAGGLNLLENFITASNSNRPLNR